MKPRFRIYRLPIQVRIYIKVSPLLLTYRVFNVSGSTSSTTTASVTVALAIGWRIGSFGADKTSKPDGVKRSRLWRYFCSE